MHDRVRGRSPQRGAPGAHSDSKDEKGVLLTPEALLDSLPGALLAPDGIPKGHPG